MVPTICILCSYDWKRWKKRLPMNKIEAPKERIMASEENKNDGMTIYNMISYTAWS